MKVFLPSIYILALALLNPKETFSNGLDSFFVQRYDNQNGLSNSAINYIFKDKDNLLWIATWDGLNMYDGNSFHVFNYGKENNSKNLPSNVTRQIAEDKIGNIWITTIEGVSRYQKQSGRFYNYFYSPNQHTKISEQEYTVAIDSSGKVFCLNPKKGLSIYHAAVDSFVTINFTKQNTQINKIVFDENNKLWILDEVEGLQVFSFENNQFKKINSFQEHSQINNFFLVNQEVFFTTTDNYLFKIHPKSFVKSSVLKMPHPLSAIAFYNQHYLLAWATKGYRVFDENFAPSSFLKNESLQMQDVKITTWALGSEAILWYGTDGNGIIKICPKTKSFATINTSENGMPYNKSVRAFCESNGDLWVATKGSGIINIQNFWNPSEQNFRKQNIIAPNDIDNNSVYALLHGNDGLIYIGTDAQGIGVYDIRNKKFYKWQNIKGNDTCSEFGSVYAIKQDEDYSVWLGTSGYGLVHLKIARGANGTLQIASIKKFIFTNTNQGPANDIIYSLAESDKDHLWVGCRYGGLSFLDKNTLLFKTFKASTYDGSLTNNDVLSLFVDVNNRIWIGTSYGLNWINLDDAKNEFPRFKKITVDEGLPNNTIHAITQDSLGNILVSTNKGLAKLTISDFKISSYQQSDGLQSNEFCDGAVWKNKTGLVFFGGTYGFNYFLPENISKSSWLPNLLVANFSVGGKSVGENSLRVLKPDSNDLVDYEINRKDNFFELDIKAISFLNADKCGYAYFLEGYDKEWHFTGNHGKIIYSNILPGKYHLKIKWSNGDGVWTKEIELFNLNVNQYFWLSFYAFLLYAMLGSLLAYLFFRNRKNKQEIKHQLEVEHLLREKEEEMHQNRLGFFTNIAHELQTPLTLIMGSAERFMDKSTIAKVSKDKPYFLSLIHQQAARLTYLVHQLLEFRKVESGFLNNQFSYIDISALVQNLAEPFIPLSEQNNMDYHIKIEPSIIGWIDKDKIEKIIFNLLSNAFKHAGRNEEIGFSANRYLNQLEINITNTGTKLPEGKLDYLFEKFYVAEPNSMDSGKFGTGIGLAFTQQLVTRLEGTIEANSKNGQINFKVSLPLNSEQGETSNLKSDHPSFLYKTITSYDEPSSPIISTTENNKQAIIQTLHKEAFKKILVVDDDPDIRFLLKDVLKEEYIIYEADDGINALELIEMIIPDLVICDVMMPNMNGLEMCNKIKNTPATCHIPFIILSARGSEEHRMDGYEVGADAYIAKPFLTKHLKLRIRKLLEYREKLVQLFQAGTTPNKLATVEINATDKDFLTQLIKNTNEHIEDSELNAEFLEKTFCLSKMQLYRKLKTLTRMTPNEFIKHLRLNQAALLLTTTTLNITEIFYQTGFNNQSYFFREFKKRYHCSPNEYREDESKSVGSN